MIDLKVNAFKAGFFDRKAVMGRLDRATRAALSKFGAFVRQRARTSIRRRRGTSPPLGPPYSHVGHLRNFLFFAYDRRTETVVIGPAKLNGVVDRNAMVALEAGGLSSTIDFEGTRRRIRVRRRPFMGPALEAEKPGLPALWRDTIR